MCATVSWNFAARTGIALSHCPRDPSFGSLDCKRFMRFYRHRHKSPSTWSIECAARKYRAILPLTSCKGTMVKKCAAVRRRTWRCETSGYKAFLRFQTKPAGEGGRCWGENGWMDSLTSYFFKKTTQQFHFEHSKISCKSAGVFISCYFFSLLLRSFASHHFSGMAIPWHQQPHDIPCTTYSRGKW